MHSTASVPASHSPPDVCRAKVLAKDAGKQADYTQFEGRSGERSWVRDCGVMCHACIRRTASSSSRKPRSP
jgi:hypothetical protein